VLSQGIAFDGVMKVLHEIPFENDAWRSWFTLH
jgi:hypothetical protein